MIELQRNGDVFVLRMVAEDNRFNARFISSLNQALDEVEGSTSPAALVTTGQGKFYSNGLDLEWMFGEGRDRIAEHVANVHDTLLRVLTLPMITVAAINGHAFAAGGMLALAHDFRVMRADRGFFCMPEVDIRIPFTRSMDILIRSRLPRMVAPEVMCTARRYGGTEAADRQIVNHSVPEAEVLPRAVEMAQSLADKDRKTLSAIKRQMYADVIEVFGRDDFGDFGSR